MAIDQDRDRLLAQAIQEIISGLVKLQQALTLPSTLPLEVPSHTGREKIARSRDQNYWFQGGHTIYLQARADANLPGGIADLDLALTNRAKNCLTTAGISKIAELQGLGADDFLRLQNCGPCTANHIRYAVAEYNKKHK